MMILLCGLRGVLHTATGCVPRVSDAANLVMFRVVPRVHDADRCLPAGLPGLPGPRFSAPGARVNFLKDTTQVKVYGVGGGERRRVVDLLGVIVHLAATVRTDHLVGLWHTASCEHSLFSRDVLSSV